MSKYLYGAAVQGIQDFIFKTNELKHIVGASELVEWICTDAFKDFAKNGESVVRAAGNIKFIFEKEVDCARAVREFPKKVMTAAPGITISQAVELLDDDFETAKKEEKPYKFKVAVDNLEKKLKTQRNKVPQSVTAGLMGIKRTNNTGLPVTRVEKSKEGEIDVYLDDATKAKLRKVDKNEDDELANPQLRVWNLCEKSFDIPVKRKNIAYDISKITGKNDWIAIIHADGNGFGQVIQKVGEFKDEFSLFSRTLDIATRNAARTAFKKLEDVEKVSRSGVIPIRPVVLDGDDMTVIIRGELALDYATEFIRAFEAETGKDESKEETGKILNGILKVHKVFENGKKNYLSACVGIAFIKSSYPFYYGYRLAEELCGQAKKDTKGIIGKDELPKSCLMFHKVQDSFITSYKDIVRRELMTKEEDEIERLSFMAGPYYLEDAPTNRYTIKQLKDFSEQLNGENGEGIISGIRQWISARIEDSKYAAQRRRRMLQVFYKMKKEDEAKPENQNKIVVKLTKEEERKDKEGKVTGKFCLAYDVLANYTIINQQTKEEGKEDEK